MAKRQKRRKVPEILPDGDPSWKEKTRELLTFLVQPRRWEEVVRFRLENRYNLSYFINCLAWLNNHGYAMSYYDDEKALWWVGWLQSEAELIADPIGEA